MHLGIGILAYNESKNVPRLCDWLFHQTILTQGAHGIRHVTIACLPNGCKDDTAAAFARDAEKRLRNLPGSVSRESDADRQNTSLHYTPDDPALPRVDVLVREVKEPGKSNAWNICVHDTLASDVDVICMVDADIWLSDQSSIARSIEPLLTDRNIIATTDVPVKVAPEDSHRSLFQRFSIAGSSLGADGLCGQFYCARGPALRNLRMPAGLPVEDGFIRAALLTQGFREDPDESVIRRIPEVMHYYEGCRNLGELMRHERRIVMGTILNRYLFEQIRRDVGTRTVADYVERQKATNADWYRHSMQEFISSGPRWLISRPMMFRRFARLRGRRGPAWLLGLPITVVATALDWIVFLSANRRLRQGRAVGAW